MIFSDCSKVAIDVVVKEEERETKITSTLLAPRRSPSLLELLCSSQKRS